MRLVKIILAVLLVFTAIFWHPKRITGNTNTFINFRVDTLATDLVVPWDIIFLPDKTMLFTERRGAVRIFRKEQLFSKPALEIKEIDLTKKMGLLGICAHPRFAGNKWIYLAWNYQNGNNTFLRVARFQFANDTLTGYQLIIDGISASQNHTGCRLRFGPDKKLYITTGDADRPAWAQDLKSLNGKILRLNDDGSIPADNPFVNNDTAHKEIWTFGHRNTQGIDFQPVSGQLFNSEHGPTGGDEVNLVEKGKNYGWPIIHHQDAREGMETPLREYTPSIGPSQLCFYNSNTIPSLKGKLLLACLRGEKIIAFELAQNRIVSEEILLPGGYGRIRALTVGPDGYIYFSTSQKDPPEGKPMPGYDLLLRLKLFSQPGKSSSIIKTQPINNSASKAPPSAITIYTQLCAACHGANMEGTDKAKSLIDNIWESGGDKKTVVQTIRKGMIDKGMPAWEGTLSEKDIARLTDLILNKSKRK